MAAKHIERRKRNRRDQGTPGSPVRGTLRSVSCAATTRHFDVRGTDCNGSAACEFQVLRECCDMQRSKDYHHEGSDSDPHADLQSFAGQHGAGNHATDTSPPSRASVLEIPCQFLGRPLGDTRGDLRESVHQRAIDRLKTSQGDARARSRACPRLVVSRALRKFSMRRSGADSSAGRARPLQG
jgi:hypothetical protein